VAERFANGTKILLQGEGERREAVVVGGCALDSGIPLRQRVALPLSLEEEDIQACE
jgi:hypothetical protein